MFMGNRTVKGSVTVCIESCPGQLKVTFVSLVRAFCCFWILRIWDCRPPRINADCCHFSASCSHRPNRQSHSYWIKPNSPYPPHGTCRFTLHVTIINSSLNPSLSFTALLHLSSLHIAYLNRYYNYSVLPWLNNICSDFNLFCFVLKCFKSRRMWAFPKGFSSSPSQGVFLPTVAFGLFTGVFIKVKLQLNSLALLFFFFTIVFKSALLVLM